MAKTKVVLEEEEYVEALGEIIERDFFPDLPSLKRQTAVLSSWDQPSPAREPTANRANALVRNRTRSEDDEKSAVESEGVQNMTLSRFVATHTSEDNEAFNELQEKAIEDHQRRYHWAFDDNSGKGDPKLHLLTDGTWISKQQRHLADEACAPKGPKDDRPSAPETWKFRARNPLLFPPDLATTRDICREKHFEWTSPMVMDEGVYKLVIVGGGPAGVGVLIRAARTGFLPRLLNPELQGIKKDLEFSSQLGLKQKGVAMLHAGDAKTFGSGNLGAYVINSNTFARSLLASILDEKPELDPPESIKNTFLERVREDESSKRLDEIGAAPASLVEFGRFLNHVGSCVLKEITCNAPESSKCLLNTAATKFEVLENGLIRVEAQSTNGSGETVVLHTEHLALAMGGMQETPSLDNPAYHSKLFTTDACLREDGFAKLKQHLLAQPTGERKVCIVGGSHSSFSVAWLLLNKLGEPKNVAVTSKSPAITNSSEEQSTEGQHRHEKAKEIDATPVLPHLAAIGAPVTAVGPIAARTTTKCDSSVAKVERAAPVAVCDGDSTPATTMFKPKDITIIHRSAIRCYYGSKKDAEADGADGSRTDRSGCVNTFTGLREDAKRLYKNVKVGRELRVRLFQVNPNGSQTVAAKAFETASAIVWGTGYRTRVLPGLDATGKPVRFQETNGVIKLDSKARLQPLGLSACSGKPPSILGLGLGFSLRSAVDEMGTETRADGVTVYHRRGAVLVLEALFGPEVYGTSTSFEEMVEKITPSPATLDEKVASKRSKDPTATPPTNPPVKLLLSRRRTSADGTGVAEEGSTRPATPTSQSPPPSGREPSGLSSTEEADARLLQETEEGPATSVVVLL
ncbi:hypothetical protein BBJ28_00002610 [Nothophytophthora sp. Chile5]|nr:hypothetical protein BBJ28_00002610 [Nothophytophthora sp. Chile5]